MEIFVAGVSLDCLRSFAVKNWLRILKSLTREDALAEIHKHHKRDADGLRYQRK